jgi:hypothetical protein
MKSERSNELAERGDNAAAPTPERLAEAIQQVRAAISACSSKGIPEETILAAMMAELMPRLCACYGHRPAASILGKVATAMGEIAAAQEKSH